MGFRQYFMVGVCVIALAILAFPAMAAEEHAEPAEHHLSKAESAAEDKDETYFVLRLGTAYYFHVGSRFGFGPAVNLDLVEGEEVWVYGVNIEVMF